MTSDEQVESTRNLRPPHVITSALSISDTVKAKSSRENTRKIVRRDNLLGISLEFTTQESKTDWARQVETI